MNPDELRVLTAQGRIQFHATGATLADGGVFTLDDPDRGLVVVEDEGLHMSCAQALGMNPLPPYVPQPAAVREDVPDTDAPVAPRAVESAPSVSEPEREPMSGVIVDEVPPVADEAPVIATPEPKEA